MLTDEQESAVYRLLRVPGMGAGAVAKVLAVWREEPGAIEGFWDGRSEEYRTRWGLPARAARFLAENGVAEAAERQAAADAATGRAAEIEVLCALEPDYAALAAARELPPVLFTRGNQDLLWEGGVAILQSRGAPEAALGWGSGIAAALAEHGIHLVSGHNRDGYRRTAAAGKRATAPLILVLDRPLHGEPAAGPRGEPVVTARIWDPEFRPARELVLSALGPGERWTPAHARGRDALIAHLASVLVAGAVRPGGTMAELCAGAAAAGRPVFHSPFCATAVDGVALPPEIEPAAAQVARALRDVTGSRAGLTVPRPGWLERRWSAAREAFIASLEAAVGAEGWVICRPQGPLSLDGAPARGEARGEPIAAVSLPTAPGAERAEVVVVGRWRPPASGDGEAPVLVLTPGEPLADLRAFQAYLARCRARVEPMLRTPPASTAPAPGQGAIRDADSSPE